VSGRGELTGLVARKSPRGVRCSSDESLGLTTASGQSLYNSRNAAHLDGQAQDKARRIEVRKYRGKLREGRNRDLLLAANRRPIIMISTFSRRRSQDHWKETKFVLIDIDKLRG